MNKIAPCMGSMTGARRSKSPTKSKSHLSKHFMLNRLMLLLGHSCISVIGADMYIWLYYKRVCLFNTIQCYIVVEQKSVTPPTCISLQIHLNTCIVWRTSFPLQNDGWGRGGGGGGFLTVTSRLSSKNYFTCGHFS